MATRCSGTASMVPTAADVPMIEHGHIETPAATPGRYKGVGEVGAIGALAVVANAVTDALPQLGALAFGHPLTPARISKATDALQAGVTDHGRRI